MFRRGDKVITPSGHEAEVLSSDSQYVYVRVNYGMNNIRHETYTAEVLRRKE